MAKKKTTKKTAIEMATKIIKKWEGFMPEPYKCPAEVPTIGYGNTRYEDGTKVTMEDEKIDRKRGEEILVHYVKEVANQVKSVVKKELTPHQEAAIISFTYNLGIGNLRDSTLLLILNVDPYDDQIPFQLRRWVKAGGKVMKGLKARREEEIQLYYGNIG